MPLRRDYVWLLFVTFLWGSGHTAGKIALRQLDAGQLALLRPASAALVLVVLVLFSRRLPRLLGELRRSSLLLLVLGLLGYAGAGGSTVLALSLLPAGITSLLTSTSPLLLVFGTLLTRRRVRPLQAIGAGLGFLGVCVLSSGGLESVAALGPQALLGVPLAIGSAACWAAYTALLPRLGGRDALVTTTLTSGIGTLAVSLVALPTQDWSRLAGTSAVTWLATLWAGGMAIGCAYVIWSRVLRRLPPGAVLPFNYTTPLFSLSIAWLVLGEPLTLPVLIGATGVIAGVVLSQLDDLRLLRRGKVARPAESA